MTPPEETGPVEESFVEQAIWDELDFQQYCEMYEGEDYTDDELKTMYLEYREQVEAAEQAEVAAAEEAVDGVQVEVGDTVDDLLNRAKALGIDIEGAQPTGPVAGAMEQLNRMKDGERPERRREQRPQQSRSGSNKKSSRGPDVVRSMRNPGAKPRPLEVTEASREMLHSMEHSAKELIYIIQEVRKVVSEELKQREGRVSPEERTEMERQVLQQQLADESIQEEEESYKEQVIQALRIIGTPDEPQPGQESAWVAERCLLVLDRADTPEEQKANARGVLAALGYQVQTSRATGTDIYVHSDDTLPTDLAYSRMPVEDAALAIIQERNRLYAQDLEWVIAQVRKASDGQVQPTFREVMLVSLNQVNYNERIDDLVMNNEALQDLTIEATDFVDDAPNKQKVTLIQQWLRKAYKGIPDAPGARPKRDFKALKRRIADDKMSAAVRARVPTLEQNTQDEQVRIDTISIYEDERVPEEMTAWGRVSSLAMQKYGVDERVVEEIAAEMVAGTKKPREGMTVDQRRGAAIDAITDIMGADMKLEDDEWRNQFGDAERARVQKLRRYAKNKENKRRVEFLRRRIVDAQSQTYLRNMVAEKQGLSLDEIQALASDVARQLGLDPVQGRADVARVLVVDMELTNDQWKNDLNEVDKQTLNTMREFARDPDNKGYVGKIRGTIERVQITPSLLSIAHEKLSVTPDKIQDIAERLSRYFKVDIVQIQQDVESVLLAFLKLDTDEFQALPEPQKRVLKQAQRFARQDRNGRFVRKVQEALSGKEAPKNKPLTSPQIEGYMVKRLGLRKKDIDTVLMEVSTAYADRADLRGDIVRAILADMDMDDHVFRGLSRGMREARKQAQQGLDRDFKVKIKKRLADAQVRNKLNEEE